MASFDEAIASLFATSSTLTGVFSTRTYDSVLGNTGTAATDYPAATWQVIDRREEPTFAGRSQVFAVSVQVDVWALTGSDRRSGASAVRSAMLGWAGTWGGVQILRVFKESDGDSTEDWGDGGPLPVYRNRTLWTVWIRDPS